MGGGCGGLAGYGPPRVEPSPASVYPWWEQPGSMWALALGQRWSTPLIRVQIASLGSTSGPGPWGERSEWTTTAGERESERKRPRKVERQKKLTGRFAKY